MLPHFPLTVLTATSALAYAHIYNKFFELNSVLGLILNNSSIMRRTVSLLRASLRREHPTKGKVTTVLAQATSAHCYKELSSIDRLDNTSTHKSGDTNWTLSIMSSYTERRRDTYLLNNVTGSAVLSY
jgi:hypothetical protein